MDHSRFLLDVEHSSQSVLFRCTVVCGTTYLLKWNTHWYDDSDTDLGVHIWEWHLHTFDLYTKKWIVIYFFLWKSILAIAFKKVEQLARSIRLVMIAFSKWHVLDDPIDLNAVSVTYLSNHFSSTKSSIRYHCNHNLNWRANFDHIFMEKQMTTSAIRSQWIFGLFM